MISTSGSEKKGGKNLECSIPTSEPITWIFPRNGTLFSNKDKPVTVDKINNPVLYKYYLDGKWDLY